MQFSENFVYGRRRLVNGYFCPELFGMNLIVDQGNTLTKLAIFQEDNILKEKAIESDRIEEIESWISSEAAEVQNVLVSSVVKEELKIEGKNVLRLDETVDLPIFNSYESPSTLGNDRIANAVAVWIKNPNANSLCIDIGTCIKYDLIKADGTYLGGNISPGLRMRYSALNHYTGKLPLIDPTEKEGIYGKDTITSIQEGVQQGIYHEIMGFIKRYSEELQPLTIFMTGGDMKYFDKEYKSPIFADLALTMFGLNEILKHNT